MSTINTTINQAVTIGNSGYYSPLTITTAGYIDSSTSGIVGVSGTVVNDGRITETNPIVGYFGIVLDDYSSIYNAGTITGASAGVRLVSGGYVYNSGTIVGDNRYAVEAAQGATVTNIGSIQGGVGVLFLGGGLVSNSGTIDGLNAVQISNGTGTVVNDGSLTGSHGGGVALEAGGSVTNNGNGIIAGGGGYAALYVGGGAGTIVDSGTILGNGGAAIAFGAGDDLLQLVPGSLVIEGAVAGNGATSTLEFTAAASSGTLTGIAAYFTGFGTATVDAGASWVLAGSNTFGPAISLTNLGTLTDVGALQNDGTVAAPSSGQSGVVVTAGGVLGNTGTISAPGGYGVQINDTGTVVNGASGSAGGLIDGFGFGVRVIGTGTATVTNYGTIEGRYGFFVDSGNTFSQTLIDAGTIIGTGGTAVAFGGGNGLLVLENGFTIAGAITANGTGNEVELLGNGATAAVTANYNSLDLTNIQTVGFAPGNANYATLDVTNDAVLPGTVAGFTGIHDTIDLTSLNDAGNDATTSFNTLTNQLTVTAGSASVTLQLDNENYTGVTWVASNDGSNGTDVTPLCFCAGTAIATPDGEVLVQHLAAGDLVMTASGQARRIVWVGAGRVLATSGRRNAATPVIVRKGALGPRMPHRDLHVTKAHALYLDGVLVPVEFLVNHRSILWDDHAHEVSLYHIELETHDVLIANGAPAESYRDDGNRWLFHNANSGWNLPPQTPCAEVLTGGPRVDAIWRRLLERSGWRPGLVLTGDPDLHLVADGRRLDAVERVEGAFVFRLPSCCRTVRIASRSAAPAELGVARDPRVLGVALRRVALRAGSRFRVIEASDNRLVEGFHDYEPDGGIRWTNGDAELPPGIFAGLAGQTELVLHVSGTTQYLADGDREQAAA